MIELFTCAFSIHVVALFDQKSNLWFSTTNIDFTHATAAKLFSDELRLQSERNVARSSSFEENL